MNKDELIEKICKRVIVVFGVLAIFNFILLINKKSYALFTNTITSDKTVVHIETADRFPMLTGPSIEVIKDTRLKNLTDTCIEPNFSGGLVAINTNGTLYKENNNEEIREYRYVGPKVNNYIYFNCQDGVEQNKDNCEVWRIIGVFKDEKGVEHLKIVRNEVLKDRKVWDSNSINDWTNASLKEYLNTEYYETLSTNAKNMIEETKYYLGNFKWADTTIVSYNHERGSTPCTPNDNGECSGGDIWDGNKTDWTGNVALMYPSDLGYANNSCNWTKSTYEASSMSSSWLMQTTDHSETEWLLSPSAYDSNEAEYWHPTGFICNNKVNYRVAYNYYDIRPSINLKSDVQITSGNGTLEEPYFLEI